MSLEKKLKAYRMSEAEYKMASDLMGHPLEGVEWAVFSALWSEHCSYKSSKIHLSKFAYRNSVTPDLDGENAGVVDCGQGEKIIFKMESHNHPSFIEPFHGAATGVGGILRDIFTMGARPIALADYLCFGEVTTPRMKQLISGVVSGISHYGNCVGVPTVTGATSNQPEYNKNILVNAMAVGLVEEGMKMALSKAKGLGNLVVYVGAATGKDGVHGASMASEAFDSDLEKKKPNIQIGDPFFEKLLIEACLEVLDKDLVVAMQDMGAAGLTSSSFEMAEKGGVGLEMHLDKVPLRDASMTPEEILLSESQERMLLVVEPAKFAELRAVFEKWGLESQILGKVQAKPEVDLFWHSEKIASLDPQKIVGKAPRYQREYSRLGHFKAPGFLVGDLTVSPSKREIFERYDQRVGVRTERDASYPCAVLRLPSQRRLGIAVGCRPELMKKHAGYGALDAFLEPYLKLSLMGLTPLAMTDCLNFGNPEKPKVMSDFVASVDVLAECAKVFDVPVISGNVSFYNETLGEQIIPTPAVGMVALGSGDGKLVQHKISIADQEVFLVHGPSCDHEQMEKLKDWARHLRSFAAAKQNQAGAVLLNSNGVFSTVLKSLSKDLGFHFHLNSKDPQHAVPEYSILVWGPTLISLQKDFPDFKIEAVGKSLPAAHALIIGDQELTRPQEEALL